MKLLNESEDGGTRHYTFQPETVSDFGWPSDRFRSFVRALSWQPIWRAVSLGQFQAKVKRDYTPDASKALIKRDEGSLAI
jgi:hypothetical protein